MAAKLHSSAVITGYLDSFCLACGSFLRTEGEACAHIGQPLHRKNLDLIPYLDKFRGDHIRKVQMGYYCEFCNTLCATATKVNLHVAEASHKHNKGTFLLKLAGNDVIAFNDVLIPARSWHGVIDNMCAVCNIEFDEESQHKSNNKHLLNLVQKPIEFGANNAIFRHVDADVIQCLTCEIVVASKTITQHFNDPKHLSIYDKCRNVNRENANGTDVAVQNGEMTNEPKVPVEKLLEKRPIRDTKTNILESIAKYQRNAILINLETETASCKKCLVNVKFDYNALEEHVANHSTSNGNVDSELLYPNNFDRNLHKVDINERADQDPSVNKAILDKLPNIDVRDATKDPESISNQKTEINNDFGDNGSETEECPEKSTMSDDSSTNHTTADVKNYAENNYITYNKDQNKAYCRVCKKRLPSGLRNIKEHVAGTLHRKNVQIASKPKPLQKKSMKNFVESKLTVKSPFFEDAVVINEKYCVNMISYMMITRAGTVSRCQACEVTLCPYDDGGVLHAHSDVHKQAIESTPVVTSVSSEFIREVRAGVFHCGFCNLVVGSWADMEMHLQCSEHDERKNFAMWRLNRLRPEIDEFKRKQAIMFMMRMMGHPFF